MNNVNQMLQSIFAMKNQGRNPQQIMQMLMQQNPQYQQTLSTLKNMANGKSPQEFIMQLAKQRGVSQENISQIMQMFGR